MAGDNNSPFPLGKGNRGCGGNCPLSQHDSPEGVWVVRRETNTLLYRINDRFYTIAQRWDIWNKTKKVV